MAIDPLTSLAFSVHSNKGVYALLVGSGVSRSAGIPTGWEVVKDLVLKLAAVQNESADPDWEAWYTSKYSGPPDFAKILEALTATRAERTALLRSYFEATEDEREQGLKRPTAAHRAIAELMRQGFVRIVLTTNFDRLIEDAMRDAGIQPTVISTVDAIQGALPLAHCRNTIVKLHGDYLDLRLKNTPEELAAYEAPVDQLLDRIFDEFGLIVSGWSAQYDTALCGAIARTPNRRFPLYWSTRGELTDAAQRLVNCRAARILRVSEADAFFSDLQQRVDALSRFEADDPISVQVAVARAKRYLSKPEFKIEYRDLLSNEVEKIVEFKSQDDLSPSNSHFTSEVIGDQMSLCEQQCSILLSILAVGAYWGSGEHYAAIVKAGKRLIEPHETKGSVSYYSNTDLRKYPALLAIYTIGIVSVARRNYELLQRLFCERVTLKNHEASQPLVVAFHQHEVIWHDNQKMIPGRADQRTPLSNHLNTVLRPLLSDLIPSDADYEEYFDWFEYLYGLQHCYHKQDWDAFYSARRAGETPAIDDWGPIGRFGWRNRWSKQWPVNQTGNGSFPEYLGDARSCLFGGTPAAQERFSVALAAFNDFVMRVVRQWH